MIMNNKDDDIRDRDEMPQHNYNHDIINHFGIGNREYSTDSRNRTFDSDIFNQYGIGNREYPNVSRNQMIDSDEEMDRMDY